MPTSNLFQTNVLAVATTELKKKLVSERYDMREFLNGHNFLVPLHEIIYHELLIEQQSTASRLPRTLSHHEFLVILENTIPMKTLSSDQLVTPLSMAMGTETVPQELESGQIQQ
jgi:hypothetical protein